MELSFHSELQRGENILEDWKDVKVPGVSKIEKIVGEFNIWSIDKLPFPKFKIKIRESNRGGYFGSTNVAVKSNIDNEPDWISGFGNSVSEALEDTIKCFFDTIGNDDMSEEDFIWADIYDF
jgi:hypothetical protein